MTAKVYWRHKGHPNAWHVIELQDGDTIGVLEVKRYILKSQMSSPLFLQKLWTQEFDYALFDAGSSRSFEFQDEKGTIRKNTHLVVHRISDPGNFLIRRLLYNEPRQGPRNIPTILRVTGR